MNQLAKLCVPGCIQNSRENQIKEEKKRNIIMIFLFKTSSLEELYVHLSAVVLIMSIEDILYMER